MRWLIALLFTFAVAAAAYLWLARGESGADVVEAELAGVKFAYARAYARDDSTAAGGVSDRLSFVASFPKFAPLAARDRAAAAVTLTVTASDDGLDPAERPSKLYARFLAAEATTGPGGLVLRRFEANSPYDFEALYIAPPDGRNFFARCPKVASNDVPNQCLSVFRRGAHDVELRFSPDLLEHWDELSGGARALLARMTGRTGRAKSPVTGIIPLRDRNRE